MAKQPHAKIQILLIKAKIHNILPLLSPQTTTPIFNTTFNSSDHPSNSHKLNTFAKNSVVWDFDLLAVFEDWDGYKSAALPEEKIYKKLV